MTLLAALFIHLSVVLLAPVWLLLALLEVLTGGAVSGQ